MRSVAVDLKPREAELANFQIAAGRIGTQKVVLAFIIEQALDAKEPDAEHELPVHHLERHVRLVLATSTCTSRVHVRFVLQQDSFR